MSEDLRVQISRDLGRALMQDVAEAIARRTSLVVDPRQRIVIASYAALAANVAIAAIMKSVPAYQGLSVDVLMEVALKRSIEKYREEEGKN